VLFQMVGQQVSDLAVVVDDQKDGGGGSLGHWRSASGKKRDLSSCLMAKARRIQSDTILFADDTRRHRPAPNRPDAGPKQ